LALWTGGPLLVSWEIDMSPEDRKSMRPSGSAGGIKALAPERRVDPGVNVNNPQRVSPPTLCAPVAPKGRGPFAEFPKKLVRSK
jgi:hypothetical protein